jgi:spoIIIJ-associated protein
VVTIREIESSGSDVESAILAGLSELKASREAVEIHVLDEGSRGLLGIGARPARVRLALKVSARPEPGPLPDVAPQVEPEISAPVELLSEPLQKEEPIQPEPTEEPTQSELERIAPIARQALEELLEKMGMQATVKDYVKPAQDPEDYHKLVLNVEGQDLGALIGRRGETLNALQFLTRLIVGREVERRINLLVDVEGYRDRRERSLRQLAQRMADRVVTTGRRQVLEPMSAAERRIIHIALRHHPDVTTESIGQGENRKVTIFLRGSK